MEILLIDVKNGDGRVLLENLTRKIKGDLTFVDYTNKSFETVRPLIVYGNCDFVVLGEDDGANLSAYSQLCLEHDIPFIFYTRDRNLFERALSETDTTQSVYFVDEYETDMQEIAKIIVEGVSMERGELAYLC